VDHQSYMLDYSNSSTTQMMILSGKEPEDTREEPEDTREEPEDTREEPEDTRGEPLFSKFNDMECSPNNPLEPSQYLLLPVMSLDLLLGRRTGVSGA
jgi:hypothetical protein